MKKKVLTGTLVAGLAISGVAGFALTNSSAAENSTQTEAFSETYTAPAAPEAALLTPDPEVNPPEVFDVNDPNALDVPVAFPNNSARGLTAQATSAPDDKIEVEHIRGRVDSGTHNKMVTVIYKVNNGASEIRATQAPSTEDAKSTIAQLKANYSSEDTALNEIEINGHVALTEETGDRKQVFLITDNMFYSINDAGTNSTMDQLLEVADMIKAK